MSSPKKDENLLGKKREKEEDLKQEEKTADKKSPTKTQNSGKKPKQIKKKIINFITGNKNKFAEISAMIKAQIPDVELNQIDIDVPELQGTPEEIVKNKLEFSLGSKAKGHPIMVDDTSLCFNAYKGLPGPYIKYFLKSIGNDGLYKMACTFDDHSAFAQCTIGLQKTKKDGPHLFVGKCNGEIVSPKGENNFGKNGWDQCFKPDISDKTFGEMTSEEKNKISHRTKAMEELIKYLKEHEEIY